MLRISPNVCLNLIDLNYIEFNIVESIIPPNGRFVKGIHRDCIRAIAHNTQELQFYPFPLW
jgi:hypothetical protein